MLHSVLRDIDQVMWILDEKGERVANSGFANKNFRVEFVETKKKCVIPVMIITYPNSKYTILFSHGNATDIGCMRDHLIDMAVKLQISIWCYDYTGYGLSKGGKPSIYHVIHDVDAIYKHMVEKKGIDAATIVAYGQSLGSGPSVHIAQKNRIRGLVLHSGLMSGLRVIRNVAKTKWFDIFPNIDNLHHVPCPVFVIHGKADEEIPLMHGEGLYNAAPNKYEPWFVEGAGHNNIEIHWREEFFNKMKAFLAWLDSHPPEVKQAS